MWIIYAVAASIFWGLNYVLAEKVFEKKVSPTTLLGIEMMVAAPILLLFSNVRKEIEIITADSYLLLLVVCSIFTMTLGNFLIATSIKEKNATLAGLIEISYPLFIMLFTLILFRTNHLTIPVGIGGCLITAGVLVIYYYS